MATKIKTITLEDFDFAPGELETLVEGARKLAGLPDEATYNAIDRLEELAATENT